MTVCRTIITIKIKIKKLLTIWKYSIFTPSLAPLLREADNISPSFFVRLYLSGASKLPRLCLAPPHMQRDKGKERGRLRFLVLFLKFTKDAQSIRLLLPQPNQSASWQLSSTGAISNYYFRFYPFSLFSEVAKSIKIKFQLAQGASLGTVVNNKTEKCENAGCFDLI